MGRTSRNQRDWEDLAELDPYWAVLTDPAGKFGGWDPAAFFETGEQEVARLFEMADRLGYPRNRGRALDFGCGLGRITRALATRFDECFGLDVSERMVDQARELNVSIPNCEFVHNVRADLACFDDSHFDLVYCKIVLQHIPKRRVVRSFIREFVRVLSPGGLLVFQIPSYIPLRERIQSDARLYGLLRTLGFKKDYLYRRMNLLPLRMGFMPEPKVLQLVENHGGIALEIHPEPWAGPTIESRTYYVTKGDNPS